MTFKIENLDASARMLSYTPLELNHMGEWDTPRGFAETLDLSYLFPVAYNAGEVTLQEGGSLSVAIRTTRSCRAYDGGSVVHSVVRAKNSGRKAKLIPWGRPQGPAGAEAVPAERVELPVSIEVRR